MKIFISGPIEGDPNYKRNFTRAESHLKAAGHLAINPCMPEGMGYKEEYLKVCFAQIRMCDAIYLLPGADHSTGSVAEQIYALLTGRAILTDEGGELVSKTIKKKDILTSSKTKGMVEKISEYIHQDRDVGELHFGMVGEVAGGM